MKRLPLVLMMMFGLGLCAADLPTLAEVVAPRFERWDLDRDGVLSGAELDRAVADPLNKGDEAAALAALKRAARSTRVKAPPLTLSYVRANTAAKPPADQPDLAKMFKEGRTILASAASRQIFAEGAPRLETIHQGKLGNCFCLAPLGAMVHRDPAQVSRLFAQDADGAYRVTLGKRTIRILPPTDAELALTSSNEGAGLWVNLYEKAVGTALNEAKPAEQRAGSPMDVLAKGGSAGTMLEFITGHEIRRISFAFAKDAKLTEAARAAQIAELVAQMESAQRDRRLMTCGTLKVTTPGLTPNHAYAVLGYDATTRMVRLWNPHGDAFAPQGEPGPTTGYVKQDGVFAMPLLAWTQQFSGMAYEVPAATPKAAFEQAEVFPFGMDDVKVYRIPGLLVTPKGTLLAYCEARRDGKSDWGEIEVRVRRSVDRGATWSKSAHVAHLAGRLEGNPHKPVGGEHEQTVNNPVMVADAKTGAITLLYCVNYARAFRMRSTDDGLSWSAPTEITGVFEPFRKYQDWKVIATGPGHGIQLRSGRLVVPVWLAYGKVGDHGPSFAGTIYSDDAGSTWQAGAVAMPNQPDIGGPNESNVAELSDGRVMLISRTTAQPNRKLVAFSADGATDWTKPTFHADLWEPVCMASLLAMPGKSPGLLFSAPRTVGVDKAGKEAPGKRGKRENLTVMLSEDDGKTWPVRRTIEAGPSAYSDLGADGRLIYCLYEGSAGIRLARFELGWLKSGR